LHDGLTTALELEWGIENLKEWYASRHSKALINYGGSVCWPYERFKAINTDERKVAEMREISAKGESSLADMQDRSSTDSDIQWPNEHYAENIKQSLLKVVSASVFPSGICPKPSRKKCTKCSNWQVN
jgi:dihydroorotase